MTPLAESGGLVMMVTNPLVVKLRRGETLFREGDKTDCLYILRSGGLRIRRGAVVYEDVQPGGMVGEMGLIERNRPRSATIVALADSELIAIDEARFFSLVAETPAFALEVMRVLSRRLRAMDLRHAATPWRQPEPVEALDRK